MSTWNHGTRAPSPLYPERGRVVVDRIEAENPRREGPRQAEEGLGFKGNYAAPFYASVYDSDSGASHRDVEVQQAGQANGRGLLGSGQAIPAWDAVGPAEMAGFAQGASGADQSAAPSPFPFAPRGGANKNTLGPTFGLNAGERPGTVYNKAIAPPNGGRGKRNPADVTDLG
jgi:hypothetical protein